MTISWGTFIYLSPNDSTSKVSQCPMGGAHYKSPQNPCSSASSTFTETLTLSDSSVLATVAGDFHPPTERTRDRFSQATIRRTTTSPVTYCHYTTADNSTALPPSSLSPPPTNHNELTKWLIDWLTACNVQVRAWLDFVHNPHTVVGMPASSRLFVVRSAESCDTVWAFGSLLQVNRTWSCERVNQSACVRGRGTRNQLLQREMYIRLLLSSQAFSRVLDAMARRMNEWISKDQKHVVADGENIGRMCFLLLSLQLLLQLLLLWGYNMRIYYSFESYASCFYYFWGIVGKWSRMDNNSWCLSSSWYYFRDKEEKMERKRQKKEI